MEVGPELSPVLIIGCSSTVATFKVKNPCVVEDCPNYPDYKNATVVLQTEGEDNCVATVLVDSESSYVGPLDGSSSATLDSWCLEGDASSLTLVAKASGECGCDACCGSTPSKFRTVTFHGFSFAYMPDPCVTEYNLLSGQCYDQLCSNTVPFPAGTAFEDADTSIANIVKSVTHTVSTPITVQIAQTADNPCIWKSEGYDEDERVVVGTVVREKQSFIKASDGCSNSETSYEVSCSTDICDCSSTCDEWPVFHESDPHYGAIRQVTQDTTTWEYSVSAYLEEKLGARTINCDIHSDSSFVAAYRHVSDDTAQGCGPLRSTDVTGDEDTLYACGELIIDHQYCWDAPKGHDLLGNAVISYGVTYVTIT